MSLTLEGKWMHLRNLVQQLIDQGWQVISCEPNESFTLTTVELER